MRCRAWKVVGVAGVTIWTVRSRLRELYSSGVVPDDLTIDDPESPVPPTPFSTAEDCAVVDALCVAASIPPPPCPSPTLVVSG